MSIISFEASVALFQRRRYTNGNTKVFREGDNAVMTLHGHRIATYYPNDYALEMSLCGWATRTTRARLSAVCSRFRLNQLGFTQSQHQQYFGSRVIGANDTVRVDLRRAEASIVGAEPPQPTEAERRGQMSLLELA